MRDQMADDGVTHERHIADDVEDLVPHELVVEAQGIVEHARVADDDRVLERSSKGEPLLAHHLDLLEEAERARRRNLLDERLLRQPNRSRLVAKHRMVERDAVSDLEVIRRVERDPLVSARQRDRLKHLEVPARVRNGLMPAS